MENAADMKSVHWSLIGGFLHLVQHGRTGGGINT